MQSIRELLTQRMREAMAAIGAEGNPMVQPSQDEKFGDYQSNAAMACAKQLGRKPRELAEQLVKNLRLDGVCEPPDIAGPGFINLRVKSSFIAQQLTEVPTGNTPQAERVGLPLAQRHEVVAVDLSSPNLAKEMHVGHLRSTVIGDCVCRVLEFLGHEVHRENHVGDWGTQFGMLVAYLRRTKPEVVERPDTLVIRDLEAFYVEAKALFDRDDDFKTESRETVVALQRGDPAVRRIWKAFCDESLRHCHDIYQWLGVRLEDRGESYYAGLMDEIVARLEQMKEQTPLVPPLAMGEEKDRPTNLPSLPPGEEKGGPPNLLPLPRSEERDHPTNLPPLPRGEHPGGSGVRESEGALCIFVEGFTTREGEPLPLIVRKSDGGYNYATSDLATIVHRVEQLKATRIVYVVGIAQKQHFDMVFAAARKVGFVPEHVSLEHLGFGSMLRKDGRPFKTREGGTVKLKELLDEAVARARRVIEEQKDEDSRRDQSLTAEQMEKVAAIVGIAAVKYFDLSHSLTSDYKFDLDIMLAMEGNTAPYMLYAYARIASIGRKAGVDYRDLPANAPIMLGHPSEVALGKKLSQFPEIIDIVARELRPNVLTDYLFDLSRTFSRFYDKKLGVRVIDASPEEVRISRLRLCDITARVLKLGLHLLGIQTVQQM